MFASRAMQAIGEWRTAGEWLGVILIRHNSNPARFSGTHNTLRHGAVVH
jgi:hypothetical protein